MRHLPTEKAKKILRHGLSALRSRFRLQSRVGVTIILLSLLTFSCISTVHLPEENFIKNALWKTVCTGIDYALLEDLSLPLRCHLLRIDLSKTEASLFAVPGEEDTYSNCVLVNTTPFTKEKNPLGIHKLNGTTYSSPREKYASLAFYTSENKIKAKILNSQDVFLTEEGDKYSSAFGGYYVILQNRIVKDSFIEHGDSRTAAGLSEDSSTLYLLCAEGEELAFSAGLSYSQCARLFKALGCSDALEFDGGSSSRMYVNGSNVLSYSSPVNVPCMFGFKW